MLTDGEDVAFGVGDPSRTHRRERDRCRESDREASANGRMALESVA
jgi:hypothetical protein